MKLSPKDNLHVDDMNREIRESMQQAQALFYILKLHAEQRLTNDPDAYANEQATDATKPPAGQNSNTDNNTESESSPAQQQQHIETDLSQMNLNKAKGGIVDSNNNSLVDQRDETTYRRPHMQTAL